MDGLEMYFDKDLVKKFADVEQNDKHKAVAQIIDNIIEYLELNFSRKFTVAELGGGAHPDRYDFLFRQLLDKGGAIDWVDISAYMLDYAKDIIEKEFPDRMKIIKFVEEDIMTYLMNTSDKSLDLILMKYVIGHIEDINTFFELISSKISASGYLISTLGNLDPVIKGTSTNARYLYNSKVIPKGEFRTLKDGDYFEVEFVNVSGDHSQGYLDGAKTTKWFHSKNKIIEIAKNNGFEVYIGNRKDYIDGDIDDVYIDQLVLVLKK